MSLRPSDTIKKGYTRAPHRSLLRATGAIEDDADFEKPFIGVCNSYIDIIPGHVHLQEFGSRVKSAIREVGGVPFEFNTIGVDDGIAMGHLGMRFSLPSRELIADAVETVARAHCLDALICISNCDKIVPGMLMGALRCNIPAIFVSGGPMKAGKLEDGTKIDLISVFAGGRPVQKWRTRSKGLRRFGALCLSNVWLLCWHVYGQLHELHYGSSGIGAAWQWQYFGGRSKASRVVGKRRAQNRGNGP